MDEVRTIVGRGRRANLEFLLTLLKLALGRCASADRGAVGGAG
jgi:hypothetical protein